MFFFFALARDVHYPSRDDTSQWEAESSTEDVRTTYNHQEGY